MALRRLLIGLTLVLAEGTPRCSDCASSKKPCFGYVDPMPFFEQPPETLSPVAAIGRTTAGTCLTAYLTRVPNAVASPGGRPAMVYV